MATLLIHSNSKWKG